MLTKRYLRNTIKEKLKVMTEIEKNTASKVIGSSVLDVIRSSGLKSVFVFISDKHEPNTHDLIAELLSLGYSVSVPVVSGDIMASSAINMNTEFVLNKYNIYEPSEIRICETPNIAIVPLVAFDSELSRIGRGKGFYDKYLSGKDLLKLGIAFSCQQVDSVVTNEFDIPLDVVVTERFVLSANE